MTLIEKKKAKEWRIKVLCTHCTAWATAESLACGKLTTNTLQFLFRVHPHPLIAHHVHGGHKKKNCSMAVHQILS